MAIGNEEDEASRALKYQRAWEFAGTQALIPFLRAHLGAVFLKDTIHAWRHVITVFSRGNRTGTRYRAASNGWPRGADTCWGFALWSAWQIRVVPRKR